MTIRVSRARHRHSCAVLAAVEKAAYLDPLDAGEKIGIVEYHDRGLAPQFGVGDFVVPGAR